MENQKYGIKWKNRVEHYQTTLAGFIDRQLFCDVTLCSKGTSFKAHQLILSVCSSYFLGIFQNVPNTQHPIIFLQDASSQEIKCLLEYMYKGETVIPKSLLSHFLKLCESLSIQGLCNEDNNISQDTTCDNIREEALITANYNVLSPNGSNIRDQNDKRHAQERKRKNKNLGVGNIQSKRIHGLQNSITEDQNGSVIVTSSPCHHVNSHHTMDSTLVYLSGNVETTNNNLIERSVLDSPPHSLEQSIVFTVEDQNSVPKTSSSLMILPNQNSGIVEISDDDFGKNISNSQSSNCDRAGAQNTNNLEPIAEESDTSLDVFRLVLSPDIPADSDESEVISSNRNITRLRDNQSREVKQKLQNTKTADDEFINEKMIAIKRGQSLKVILSKTPLDESLRVDESNQSRNEADQTNQSVEKLQANESESNTKQFCKVLNDSQCKICRKKCELHDTFHYEDPLLVTGILKAVVEGDLEKVKKLIEEGKSPNINDNHGNTPLHVAVIKNLDEIVDYLLTLEEVSANRINFYGQTPIFMAAKGGYLHLVEKLIKANGNVNLATSEDVTPLHVSVKYPKIAHLLIQNGARIDAVDYRRETALHEAVSEKCVETICMLLHYDADANVQCSNNLTPFMKAIILENLEIQEILLDYVVDFNSKTKQGMTILNLALTHNCPYVKDIIDRGADVNYEHSNLNAFLMCLLVPNTDHFKLIWKKFKYQRLYTGVSYLEQLIQDLDENNIYEYLRIIIDSNNIEPIFIDFDFFPLYNWIKRRIHNRPAWLQLSYELICLFLCQGNILHCDVICQLYELFGYNQLLYICLHMDIHLSSNNLNVSMATLFYNTRLTVDNFKTLVFKWIQNVEAISIRQFLPYIRLSGTVNSRYREEDKIDYEKLCQLPSLLEMSRNSTRDYFVHTFNLNNSKQYYLFVQNMPISNVHKNILTFKKPVYTV